MLEAERKQLIDRPFTVRDRNGNLLTARAYGYALTEPGVQVEGHDEDCEADCDLTWYGLKAAIERGAVVNILDWFHSECKLPHA